jgi:hypothetical protein
MKVRYTGKEPFRFAGFPGVIIIKKGEVIDMPEARVKKWLDDPELSKLFELVKEKPVEKKSKKEKQT